MAEVPNANLLFSTRYHLPRSQARSFRKISVMYLCAVEPDAEYPSRMTSRQIRDEHTGFTIPDLRDTQQPTSTSLETVTYSARTP